MLDWISKNLASQNKRPPPKRQPAVEVLREGYLAPQRYYAGTCSRCSARVRFREDAALPNHYAYNPHPYKRVVCPTSDCGNTILGSPTPPPMQDN
jgi:hypothetical protein